MKRGQPPSALRGLHRFALFTAFAGFCLVVAGGLVTSTDSGLAVPDWPLSYGTLLPPMVGGIRFEHSHRMIAAAVGLMTLWLALGLIFREPRASVRWLGIGAFGLVVFQGILGGVTVLWGLPPAVSIAHAATGQLFFATLVILADRLRGAGPSSRPPSSLGQPPSWGLKPAESGAFLVGSTPRRLALVTTAAIYLQLLLGASMRHLGWFPRLLAAHLLGAVIVTALAAVTSRLVLKEAAAGSGKGRLTRLTLPARVLSWGVLVQLFLGAATFLRGADLFSATAHVAVGAALLAASALLTVRLGSDPARREGSDPARREGSDPARREGSDPARRATDLTGLTPQEGQAPQVASPPRWASPRRLTPQGGQAPQRGQAPQVASPPRWASPRRLTPQEGQAPQVARPPRWASPRRLTPQGGQAPQVASPPRWASPRRLTLWSSYAELAKPRLTGLAVVTALIGFALAGGGQASIWKWLALLLGTCAIGAGAGALNQVLEWPQDGRMARTRNRPIPTGRISPESALRFGVGAGAAGLGLLALGSSLLSAALAGLTLAVYLFLYTPLKKRSGLCTLVGAIPGALPPLIGWAAVRSTLDPGAWALFAILFVWQLPHFLALAWAFREDYTRAGFKMLPVLDPEGGLTFRQMVLYTAALLPVSLVPCLLGLAGWIYFFAALSAGLFFLGLGIQTARARTAGAVRRLFGASIGYLPFVLTTLTLEQMI